MQEPTFVRNRGRISANQLFVLLAASLFLALVILSFAFEELDGPRPWLTEWTNWAAKYAALVIAVHSIYKLVDAAAFRLKELSGSGSDGQRSKKDG
jgi:hypothetical protein